MLSANYHRRVAVAQVAQEIGLHGGVAPEGPVDRLRVEAGHRPAVKPDRARREDEAAGLQARVAECGDRRVGRFAACGKSI